MLSPTLNMGLIIVDRKLATIGNFDLCMIGSNAKL